MTIIAQEKHDFVWHFQQEKIYNRLCIFSMDLILCLFLRFTYNTSNKTALLSCNVVALKKKIQCKSNRFCCEVWDVTTAPSFSTRTYIWQGTFPMLHVGVRPLFFPHAHFPPGLGTASPKVKHEHQRLHLYVLQVFPFISLDFLFQADMFLWPYWLVFIA